MKKGMLQNKLENKKTTGTILLAEDDHEMRNMLIQTLNHAGYAVVECRDGAQLVNCLSDRILEQRLADQYDLIISDIRMPGVSGMTILRGIHELRGFPPVIMITAFGDEKTHAEAARLGAAVVLDKPFDLDTLVTHVRRLLAKQRG